MFMLGGPKILFPEEVREKARAQPAKKEYEDSPYRGKKEWPRSLKVGPRGSKPLCQSRTTCRKQTSGRATRRSEGGPGASESEGGSSKSRNPLVEMGKGGYRSRVPASPRTLCVNCETCPPTFSGTLRDRGES